MNYCRSKCSPAWKSSRRQTFIRSARTMYFCLTGEEPPSALDRAFDDTLPPGLRGLDRNTEKVILKGMSLKPEGRYASAEELMQALGGQTKGAEAPAGAKNQKGTLKWLPAVLGCIAAIAVLVLIPVALLTGREEQSGNAKKLPAADCGANHQKHTDRKHKNRRKHQRRLRRRRRIPRRRKQIHCKPIRCKLRLTPQSLRLANRYQAYDCMDRAAWIYTRTGLPWRRSSRGRRR